MNQTKHTIASDSQDNQATVELQQALRRQLLALPFHGFERCVGSVLRSMGYTAVRIRRERRGRNRDGGWDIDAAFPTGLTEVRAIAQVKQYESTRVQKRYVDELRGCMLRTNAGQGILATLSTFSKTARSAAGSGTIAPIRLIEGDELTRFMIERKIGVTKNHAGYDTIDAEFFKRLSRSTVRTHHRSLVGGDLASTSTDADARSVTLVVSTRRPLRIVWNKPQ